MFSLLSLQNRYVLTKRHVIENTADIFRWWNNENKHSLLLTSSGDDSVLTEIFSGKNSNIICTEVCVNNEFFSWSLLSSFSSSVLAQFSECSVRKLSSKLPLNHYLGHTKSTSITISWKVSVLSPGVLVTVIHSARVTLVTRCII